MSIDNTEVMHMAKLARLKLNDEEVKQFSEELSVILGYINKLNELNVEGIEPVLHALDSGTAVRKDEVKPSLDQEAVFLNAPDAEHGHFKVPRVIE